MISIPIHGRKTNNELRLQPLNPTQHRSCWRPPIGRDQKLWENKINPQVWDQGTPGRAHQDEPVIIVFQDVTWFPNWKQYPLRREAQEGLQPLINKFLVCGQLISTILPCNAPILPVKKKDGTWWMVQDLWIINEAVVPLHPTVSNPSYVILEEIPPSAKWFMSWISKMLFLHITG